MCGQSISENHEESVGDADPVIFFSEQEQKSLVLINKTLRKIRSTRLGAIDFIVESGIDSSGKRIVPDEFRRFAPKGKSFSFDTIWAVTRMHFIEYKQREEIQAILPFPISTGAISNLYKEGLAYFRACHEVAIPELKKLYRQKGRLFVLQIDGTNEGGKWTHFQVRDSVSGNVLLAKRIPTENRDDIEMMLKTIEEQFGKPDAVIIDMSGSGISAVTNLWKGTVPVFICQFHFLRDIGKDILGPLHENLRKIFTSCRTTAKLNALRKSLVEVSGKENSDFMQEIDLIDWILDYRSELEGKGVPFDLAWKNYYERCMAADLHIKGILDTKNHRNRRRSPQILVRIKIILSNILKNKASSRRYNALSARVATFMEIRDIFHLVATDNKTAPLSSDAIADASVEILPEELQAKIINMATKLREESAALGKADSKRYIKAAEQLEKYQAQLRNHIEVDGKRHPLPRTNNLCEISFREEKRGIRRTNGKKNLAHVFDQMPAEIMYLQNLKDPVYCKIVFGDRPIHDVFGEISQDSVKDILKKMGSNHSKKAINPVIKQPDFLIRSKGFFLKWTG